MVALFVPVVQNETKEERGEAKQREEELDLGEGILRGDPGDNEREYGQRQVQGRCTTHNTQHIQ